MRIRLAIPDHLVTPEALEAALEATALASEQAIRNGEVPPLQDAISRGVRWREEPFTDGEHFDLPAQVLGRGWGDCDDLAPWLAGELRATGEDPGAIPRVYQTGANRWHVVVQTSSGEVLDPSRWAGMGRRKSVAGCSNGVCGRTARPFARPGSGAIALMPRYGSYWARADVPYPDSDAHLASHARARTPELALERAVSGAIACADGLGLDRDRLAGAASILIGDAEDLDRIGVLPLAASLAPMAMEQGMSFAKGLLAKGSGRTFRDLQAKVIAKALRKKGATEEQVAEALRGFTAENYPKLAAKEMPVSVPLEAAPPAGVEQHMMLTYYPLNAQGPVVMRF